MSSGYRTWLIRSLDISEDDLIRPEHLHPRLEDRIVLVPLVHVDRSVVGVDGDLHGVPDVVDLIIGQGRHIVRSGLRGGVLGGLLQRLRCRIGVVLGRCVAEDSTTETDRKSTRLNSSHVAISYAVFCL